MINRIRKWFDSTSDSTWDPAPELDSTNYIIQPYAPYSTGMISPSPPPLIQSPSPSIWQNWQLPLRPPTGMNSEVIRWKLTLIATKKLEEAETEEDRVMAADMFPSDSRMKEVEEWMEAWGGNMAGMLERWPQMRTVFGFQAEEQVERPSLEGPEMPGWLAKWMPIWAIWKVEDVPTYLSTNMGMRSYQTAVWEDRIR